MLDREVVKEFLEENFNERGMKVPKEIKKSDLVETFCLYVEDDYYEWLRDNYQSFFHNLSQGKTDWDWIKERIDHYSKE
ncbi:MAG: hypothetical protein KAW92_06965 [Candidatus Cloacimonetes bacterium]|nr:hypothetical protein [Candidatus Cloacimonadota bacterium]